ncbi:PBP1A family penicillin-binding protein [Paenibacillus nanensis]|uniref:PBP1A family penicillin-binding protein n=1 Tax=Paenibacillus nanensis TaxID=393251 RepID=A0A3A1UYM5_9BACL|nr:PBP1A family penicillin-binding protein [Paenibacillus nanensis]RIX53587.1 PBP1A family penicillin-binding protein [Paenibacillus nanensis]
MREQTKRTKTSGAKPKKRKKRISGRGWFYGIFFTIVIGIVCGIIGYLLIVLNGERILEENGSKLEFGEASIIYDAEGQEISRLYDYMDHREIAEFAEIPEVMRNAIVATEDERFYEHSGLDFWAIGRAVVKDVIARSAVEGASTITQQLAKNVFLSADKTFFRKATEASIAVALEQQMTKDEILTMYLNRIYFGKGIHGIKAAADYYFGVELQDLELWQAATLAAMPKAPNRYNPVNDPEASMNRRAVVLELMYKQGYITAEEKEQAKAVVYKAPARAEEMKNGSYQAYVDYVIEEAMEITNMTEEELRVSGLHIYTSLSQQAQKAMDEQYANDDNFEKSNDDQISQSSMIIIDHRNGEIKALSGGRYYEEKGWNRVDKRRQPGSAIKPLVVYGPALETGKYFPWTTLKNDKKCFSNYCPSDAWGAVPVTMTQAVKESRNLAAVWMLNEIGVSKGAAFAEKLGLQIEKEDRNLALALGGLTKGASPLEMATAYSIIANGGKSVDPHTITKIEGKSYKGYEYESPAAKQLMSPDTAWYLTEMMQSVVSKGGTGARAAIDRPVAGKTGTTQHGIPGLKGDKIRDAWFVGYTPEWTAAVWMGYDKTDKDHLLTKGGGQSAAALFSKVMLPAMKGVEKGSFGQPEGVKKEETPMKITNFKAEFVEEEVKVRLSWDPLDDKDITYEVYRKESGASDYIHFSDAVNPYVEDMSVFPGVTYEYYVLAYDAKTEKRSDPTTAITVSIPEVSLDLPDIPMEPVPSDPVETLPGEEGLPPETGGGIGNGGDGGLPIETDTPQNTEQPGTGNGEGATEPTPTPSTEQNIDQLLERLGDDGV